MSSVRRISEPTALHLEWQPDPLCCVGRSVDRVDADGSLEELEDVLVDALGEVLREVRPDMPQPVVSHELKAHHRQNPEYLPGWYLRVRPSLWVEELLHFVESSCDGPHLQGDVVLDKEFGPDGHLVRCDAIVGVPSVLPVSPSKSLSTPVGMSPHYRSHSAFPKASAM